MAKKDNSAAALVLAQDQKHRRGPNGAASQDSEEKAIANHFFKTALNFFNDFFKEQEDVENREKRAQLKKEQKETNYFGMRGTQQQAIIPMQNRE